MMLARPSTVGLLRWIGKQGHMCVAWVVAWHAQALAQPWTAEMGLVHWSYKEPQVAVIHEGWLPTLGISKTWDREQVSPGQWALSANLALGRVDYRGTGTMQGQPLMDAQTMLVYLLPAKQPNTFWGPTLAYDRVFNDARGVTSTGHGGYRRLNQRWSVGMQWRETTAGGWQWRGDAQALLRGWQVSELSDIGGEYQGVTAPVNVQRQGWALKLGICQPLTSGRLCIQAQHTRIQASDTVLVKTLQSRYEAFEPANKYTRIGLTFQQPLNFD